jgi:hypothetical protein
LWSGLSKEKSGAISPTSIMPLLATFHSGLNGSTTNAGHGTYFIVRAKLSGDRCMMAKSAPVTQAYRTTSAAKIVISFFIEKIRQRASPVGAFSNGQRYTPTAVESLVFSEYFIVAENAPAKPPGI